MTAPPKHISDWIAYASEDLHAAETLFREKIYAQACFHAHQCVEKTLKAFILTKLHKPKRIHDLNELLAVSINAGEKKLSNFADDIAALNSFYIPTRYPDGIPGSLPDRLPNRDDAHEALKTARDILKTISQEIHHTTT